MTLRDLQQRHAGGIVTSAAYHGEQVTRRRTGAVDLVLNVAIKRRGREWQEDGARVAFERAEVFVPSGNDVVDGDDLLFAMVDGGEVTTNRIEHLIRRGGSGSLWEVVR